MESAAIEIGKRREVFWDNYLIDTERTTAVPRAMQAVEKECCFRLDQGEELSGVSYLHIVNADNGYRMYYMSHDYFKKDEVEIRLAVLESKDGINWIKPHLDIFPHPELKENNIIIDRIDDNAFVFNDPNPECPKEEKFKALCLEYVNGDYNNRTLWCYTSPDGYHFKRAYLMSDKAKFDTLNTVYWKDGKYVCYVRGLHFEPGGGLFDIVRDIRVMYSEDFRNWTEPKRLEFDDEFDPQLYTNNVMVYDRAPHMSIGLPTRYCERKVWTDHEEQFRSVAVKKRSIDGIELRMGLAVTDCIFMCSRDGEKWHKYNEAFLTPGLENEHNWIYGDCYVSHNLLDAGGDVYYLYAQKNVLTRDYPVEIYRYEIRKDGFACLAADGNERIVVTKPVAFEGKDLHLNFSTSGYGYIYVDVLDKDGNPLSCKQSFEIYGDNTDRKIAFADGTDFSEFSGKPVRLRFRMREAKLYSMYFE